MADDLKDYPLGSNAFPVFDKNVQNLDRAINDIESEQWTDRFGNVRRTWNGIEQKAEFDISQAVSEATVQAEDARDEAIAAAAASGDFDFVLTYADAEALLPLPDGRVVEVAVDETKDGSRTRYIVEGGTLEFAVYLDQTKRDLANTSDPSMGAGMIARGVVSVPDVPSLLALPLAARMTDKTYRVAGYNPGTRLGGGDFIYDPSRSSENDGGLVLDGFVRVIDFTPRLPEHFGAYGDKIHNDFSAIEKASISAGIDGVVYYQSKNYLIEGGELPLYTGAKHVSAVGTRLFRSAPDSMRAGFKGASVSGIRFVNLEIQLTVETGANPEAACVRLDDSEDIEFSGCLLTGGQSGLQAYYCENVRFYDSEATGNRLTGISGFIKGLDLQRSKIHKNGYISGGFTHEVYCINSPGGRVLDCQIGDNVEDGYSLYVKNKTSEATPDFPNCDGWEVGRNSFFGDRGPYFANSSSEGEALADQIPHRNHRFYKNQYAGGAGLLIASPSGVEMSGDAGAIGAPLLVTAGSTYPGYQASLTASDSTFDYFGLASLNNGSGATDGLKFIDCTALTSGPAIRRIPTFGGQARGTFHNFKAPNSSAIMSDITDAVSNRVLFRSTQSLPQLNSRPIITSTNATEYTPDINLGQSRLQRFNVFSASGTLINNTGPAPDGAELTLLLVQAGSGSNRPLSFGTEYKTAGDFSANAVGQVLVMRFLRSAGFWVQIGSAAWAG